jgi:hypothetical protein
MERKSGDFAMMTKKSDLILLNLFIAAIALSGANAFAQDEKSGGASTFDAIGNGPGFLETSDYGTRHLAAANDASEPSESAIESGTPAEDTISQNQAAPTPPAHFGDESSAAPPAAPIPGKKKLTTRDTPPWERKTASRGDDEAGVRRERAKDGPLELDVASIDVAPRSVKAWKKGKIGYFSIEDDRAPAAIREAADQISRRLLATYPELDKVEYKSTSHHAK